jgi:ABC-type nitrate/sulfonate/bicarbonate transport system substrate-binding protein
MFVWKRYAAALVATLGTVGIFGLGLSPELAVAQAKLTPIKVGVLKIGGLANAYAAKKEKMFEKNGLDAALVEFRSGDAMLLAAQSGGIDVALVIPGTGMTADEHGFDFLAARRKSTSGGRVNLETHVAARAKSRTKCHY